MAENPWGSVKNTPTYTTAPAQISIVEGLVRICYVDYYDFKDPTKVTKENRFADGKQCKTFSPDELPIQFDSSDSELSITLIVKSEDNKVIEFLPYNETVKGRFVGFHRVNGEGTAPIPSEGRKFKEDSPDVLQFIPKFKIEDAESAFDGKILFDWMQFAKSGISKKGKPYTMYTFETEPAGTVGLGFEYTPAFTTAYPWSNKVLSLRHCGMFDGELIVMPEDKNPLPQIEEKLLRANRLVELHIEKGKLSAITPVKKVEVFKKPTKTNPVPAQTASEVVESPDEM